MMDRRFFLRAAAGTAGLAVSGFTPEALASEGLKLGEAAPFSFDELKAHAKSLAGAPYVAPVPPRPDVLTRIDYDAHGKIRFKTENALWSDGPGAYPVTFFHLGRFFQKPVHMHVVEG